MKMSHKRSLNLLVAGATLALAGCGDSPTGLMTEPGGSSLTLNYSDGGRYQASGTPSVDGGQVSASTFAVAFRDSVGGVVITGFQQTDGTRGDLFVLQLTDTRTGTFGPCGANEECHGRIVGDFDAQTRRSTGGPYYEIVSGSVQVDQAGPDRLKGSITDLVLQAQDSIRPDRTVESGTFDLQLLSDQEGKAALAGLLCEAAQPLSGVGCPQAAGHQLSFTYDDNEQFNTFGDPIIDGGELSLASFATAFPDSVGGLVIAAFETTNTKESRGDLFILQLTDVRTGSFGPCGVGQSCQGRVMEDFDTDQLRPFGHVWEMAGGNVQVDTYGAGHLKGSFSGLVLKDQAQDSVLPDRTIESGTFDLTLLSQAEGVAAMQCFLATVSGSGGC